MWWSLAVFVVFALAGLALGGALGFIGGVWRGYGWGLSAKMRQHGFLRPIDDPGGWSTEDVMHHALHSMGQHHLVEKR